MEDLIPLASYRQAIAVNELLKKVVVGLMILSTVLAVVIGSLFPLKEVKYKLYEFSSSGQSFKHIEDARSEERRVGKECRSRGSPAHVKKKNNRRCEALYLK